MPKAASLIRIRPQTHVPFHYIDDMATGSRLFSGKSLEDVAPTFLGIMGIDTPMEMTGSDIRML
ncbi:MAG: hypothetical protein ABIP78_06850 [Pyrinomonadaceae bacterium]